MAAEYVELADDGSVDPWSVHLPGRETVPAYLVAQHAAQYRAIVDVLLVEQDSSLTGLSFDEIRTALGMHLAKRVPAEVALALLDPACLPLDDRLDRLVRWQVVTRWQGPARTGEDFLRRRDRYQLTPLAARLHGFWSQADDADDDAAADLTLAPRAIFDRLGAFAEAVASDDYPAAAAEFQQIGALHQAMGTAARAWQRTLAHALSGAPDQGKQELLWRTLQSYIGMWGEQVDVHSPRITELMGELGQRLGPAQWRACARAALVDATEELVASQAQRWARAWEALGSWFSGADGQARRLRRQLRDLVAPWARNMHILMDAGGVVTRRAELLRLAVAIERAENEEAAWLAWDTAVGVFSARHLLLPADTADDQAVPWRMAPAAPVTARFREHGTRAAVGRRPSASDFSAGKAAARQARVAAQAARGEAEASLRQRSGTNLAGWDCVGEAELDLMLEFLGAAGRSGDGVGQQPRPAVTADGRWRVTFTPPPSTADTTTVHCPSGALVTPNWRFDMEPA